jgi:flagellar biosynthesis regulator FlbT
MTLKLTLKPGESVFIGTTRLSVVSRATCTVLIDGNAPVIRASEWLNESEATEALPRFRYILQEMYLRDDRVGLIQDYFVAAANLLAEMPQARISVARINELLLDGSLWDAVKVGKDLARQSSAPAEERVCASLTAA